MKMDQLSSIRQSFHTIGNAMRVIDRPPLMAKGNGSFSPHRVLEYPNPDQTVGAQRTGPTQQYTRIEDTPYIVD